MLARVAVMLFGSVWKIKAHCTSRNGLVARFFRVIWGAYQYENGSSIAWNAIFATEPCFPHGMKSIFISGAAKIGSNCVIFQQVTIGSISLPDSGGFGAPILGDNVYVGAGAKIVGNIRVGNNVRIGANAVVFRDVPDNCVVVVGDQRVIQKDVPLDNRFYSFQGRWVYFSDGRYLPVEDGAILTKLHRLG